LCGKRAVSGLNGLYKDGVWTKSMNNLARFPLIIFVSTFIVMLFSARLGAFMRKRGPVVEEAARHDLDLIVAAVLTLLGLVIGFSFSMATNRYDLRKTYEEAEANAIGTEYVRAELLPPSEASRVKLLLKEYLDQRILFYQSRDEQELKSVNARIAKLQSELWSIVQASALAQPTPVMALVVSGINDVLNSQGYTQAAWWNRIPLGAWLLMILVAICCNVLVGYGGRSTESGMARLLVLPIVLCIAFFLVADIDSPRRGVIVVRPLNLISLAQSVHAQ
jgi:hypothetical protein